MTDFNSPEYQAYLKDQKEDNINGSYDERYLAVLKGWIPDYDYRGKAILDIGTRAFESWEYFRDNYDTDITGIDIGQEGIDFCLSQNKTGFIEMDAHRMDEHFKEDTFDLVLAFHSFEHMYNLPLVIKHCCKIIKPGGYLFFALPMPSFNWGHGHWYDVPTEEVMHQMCTHRGFRVLRTVTYRELEIRPQVEMICLVEKL